MRSKHGQEHGIRGVLASGWAEVGLVLLTTLVAMALLLPGCDRPKQPQVGAPPAEVVVLDPSDIDEFRADALRRLDALGAQLAAARERIAEAPVDRRLDVDAELAALEQRHESLRVQLVELESTTPEDERGAARTRVETGIDQLELEVEHAVGQLKGTGA